ncbi:MAG: lysine-2,3-aminomutase-like protein [Caulobacteraceae bacterium]|nr:lysine-2,3-aminomutase-like protein [Caulobacteraceae bacterium]
MSETVTLTSPAAMARAGLVAPERLADLEAVAARYAVAVTPTSADLIDPSDPGDPIGLQFLPHAAELLTAADEVADPIGDLAKSPVEGIVHRYPDRVLLTPTLVCATYCRFCFRRERVGPGRGGSLTAAQLDAALAYIAERTEIWEVILTGGDPLVLSARRLSALMSRLGKIDHVKVVRIHTRVPAVAPERITPALISALRRSGKAVYVGLHANHPRELTPEVRAACARMIDAGIPMLSQSVLLRGVNDDPQVLAELMRAFVETRIRPYYLHHGDAAPGTSHLRLGLAEGQALVRSLRGRISGLAQPTFVLDIPGGHGKVPVGPGYLSEDRRRVEDPWGEPHDLDG